MDDAHYASSVPQYLNVASLGLTLAHEAIHSLDQTGRQFDFRGTHRRSWDQESERAYANRSDCVVKQYTNHFRRPLTIDKRRTTLVEVPNNAYKGCFLKFERQNLCRWMVSSLRTRTCATWMG